MNLTKILILTTLLCTISACQDNASAEDKQATHSSSSENQATDNKGINFTLTNLQGEPVQASDYRGKWLVLNYWATWCGPCRDEMPELVKFQANNSDVQVLGIAYEDSEIEKLQSFVKDFDINYPILTIDVYNPPAFAEEGGLGLPTTIVYNKEGVKHEKHMGPIDYDGLMAMVNKNSK